MLILLYFFESWAKLNRFIDVEGSEMCMFMGYYDYSISLGSSLSALLQVTFCYVCSQMFCPNVYVHSI